MSDNISGNCGKSSPGNLINWLGLFPPRPVSFSPRDEYSWRSEESGGREGGRFSPLLILKLFSLFSTQSGDCHNPNPRKIWKNKFPILYVNIKDYHPLFSYNIAHIIFVFVVVVYHNILSVGVQIIPLLVLFLFCLSRFLYDSGQV